MLLIQNGRVLDPWTGTDAQLDVLIGNDGVIAKDTYGDWCMPPESPELIHSQDPARKTAAPPIATPFFLAYSKAAFTSGFCIIELSAQARLIFTRSW